VVNAQAASLDTKGGVFISLSFRQDSLSAPGLWLQQLLLMRHAGHRVLA
jgi:hypothetical protein